MITLSFPEFYAIIIATINTTIIILTYVGKLNR